uniref:Uncharacterized protein n=1 Tax=Oryzias melastigma TaxID=30732 RepID=A0A3B3BMD1_ORYME
MVPSSPRGLLCEPQVFPISHQAHVCISSCGFLCTVSQCLRTSGCITLSPWDLSDNSWLDLRTRVILPALGLPRLPTQTAG